MGNKTGSVRKLDDDSDTDDEHPVVNKSSHNRKSAHPPPTIKGCDTEPPNRRRSSGGNNGNESGAAAAAAAAVGTTSSSKKKTNSLLSEHQKQLISRSWKQHVNRHSTDNVGVRMFFNIFEASPEIKQIFGFDDTTATRETLLFDKRFQRQAKLFVKVIDEAVRDIENLEDDVQKRLYQLGARHVKFRSANQGGGAFKMQHWDTFAESMLESIIDSQRGVHKYRDTTATWRIFITWLTGIMKQGYYETLRAERRATTAGLPQAHFDPPNAVRSQNRVSESAPVSTGSAYGSVQGSASISTSGASYSRNHSVCYAHYETDLLRQHLHPPPPPSTTQSSSIHQKFLEPTQQIVASRSAPHSPYVVKPPPRHYSPAPNLTTFQYDSYPKRGQALEEAAEQQKLIAARTARIGERTSPRNYDYDEENEYESRDENYPKHYYSDYY